MKLGSLLEQIITFKNLVILDKMDQIRFTFLAKYYFVNLKSVFECFPLGWKWMNEDMRGKMN